MNTLSLEQRRQILQLLVEGNSIRSTCRITGVYKNAVTKFLVRTGEACMDFHNQSVVAVKSKRIQCDEIWSFVYAKQKNVTETIEAMQNGAGDAWTWTGIDADSKLVVSWFVGNRDAESAEVFMHDLASRLANKVQLTTDGHKPYLEAVDNAFKLDIDYAMLIKIYGEPGGEKSSERKYSPSEYSGSIKKVVSGEPKEKFISTSYVERQNLTMRMHMRRFTRLTNGFSKKIENHCHAIALHFVYYNFCKIHKSLSVTPAMQAGLTKRLMKIEDIVMLTDHLYKAPKTRGSYKKIEKAN